MCEEIPFECPKINTCPLEVPREYFREICFSDKWILCRYSDPYRTQYIRKPSLWLKEELGEAHQIQLHSSLEEKIYDLLLTIDGLKLQEKILPKDLELVSSKLEELSRELEVLRREKYESSSRDK